MREGPAKQSMKSPQSTTLKQRSKLLAAGRCSRQAGTSKSLGGGSKAKGDHGRARPKPARTPAAMNFRISRPSGRVAYEFVEFRISKI